MVVFGSVYWRRYILSFFSPKTLDKICFKFTSPKIPLLFLSVRILWSDTMSPDKLSIFFWASSILDNLSRTLVNVLFVLLKFSSSLSFILSLIIINLFSTLSSNFSKSSDILLDKSVLNVDNSLMVVVSTFPNFSIKLLLPLDNNIITKIIIITRRAIIIYSVILFIPSF